MSETGPDSGSDFLDRFDIVTFHVDDTHGHVLNCRDFADDIEFRELTAGHLEVNLVELHAQEGGKHRPVAPGPHCSRLVIPKAKMGGEPAFSKDRLDGSIEDVRESRRVFAVRI